MDIHKFEVWKVFVIYDAYYIIYLRTFFAHGGVSKKLLI